MTVLRDIAEIVHQSANIVTALVEYKVSDQCRLIEGGITRASLGWGFLKIFFLLLAAGLGFLLWGLYRFLTMQLYPPTAAVILGGAALLAGLCICWLVVLTAPKNHPRP